MYGFCCFLRIKVRHLAPYNSCRRILHTIKVNHDSQRPEALARNFTLLSEVNANIEAVQHVYLQIEEDYVGFMKSQAIPPGGKTNS